MLQKGTLATTLSVSATNKPTSAGGLDTPIQFVKGVGPRLSMMFQSRNISTIKDLLFFFPRAYQDRSQVHKIVDLKALADKTAEKGFELKVSEGASSPGPAPETSAVVTVSGRVISQRKIPTRYGKSILDVRISDGTGVLALKWFHAPKGMAEQFFKDRPLTVTGAIKFFQLYPEMVHPEVSFSGPASPESQASAPESENYGRIVPIYVEIEGIPTRTLRKILWDAVTRFSHHLTEDLPLEILKRLNLPTLPEAVRALHFPPEKTDLQAFESFNSPFHHRLVYDEFFKFEFLVLKQRLRMEKQLAETITDERGVKACWDLSKTLPFELTGDQKKAIKETLDDLKQSHPMNRLIQGDVGSGKTAVAFLTASAITAEGGQVALMAPTEILAEQHLKNGRALLGHALQFELLTGRTSAKEHARIVDRLTRGDPLILIGTHALIEEPVVFKSLNYILIDEQHRFGVDQRRALRQKGIRIGKDDKPLNPHTLILTATPIPRTLALTAYGDLAVSTIKEKPPGRTPIVTRVIRSSQREKAHEWIKQELQKGRQAYFIYPLVNDSEAEGFTHLKSAIKEAEELQARYSDFKVALLHGQQKSEEKALAMEEFKSGRAHLLVSTTVVEVGVDVANASIMAINHAERFGLSQLHQLRGRVGRGAHASYCFLFTTHDRPAEVSQMRLDVLEKTNDGFEIAEADLELRGPGEFLGTRQSGGLPFKLAQLVRDRNWLLEARDDAAILLKNDPELTAANHLPLRRYFEREGTFQFERLKTS